MEENSELWERLKKQARQLELSLQAKLTQLSKLVQSLKSAAKKPEPNAPSASGRIQPLDSEVKGILQKLSELIDQMIRCNSTGLSDVNAQHTLQRYRNIFYESNQEYNRIRNVITTIQREELLGDPDHRMEGGVVRARTDLLMREKGSLQNSLRLADEAIDQVIDTRTSLEFQQSKFATIKGKLGDLSARFPRVSNVIGSIQRHKQRDMIVLSIVIAACLALTLLYICTK